MATSAFKSTSRRGNAHENLNSANNAPPKRRTQRSLSVSAVPRTQLDVDSDFSNKRDNPLFWSATSPPDRETAQKSPQKSAQNLVNDCASTTKSAGVGQRGRSVTRNADIKSKKTTGRSLSRGHYVYGASESEVEQEFARSANYGSMSNTKSAPNIVKRPNPVRRGAYKTEVEEESVKSSNYRSTRKSIIASKDIEKPNLVRNVAGTLERTSSLQSLSSHHSHTAASDDITASLNIPNWEDEISTGSISEVEEKTIKAVCEQMKGNQTGSVTSTSGIYETVQSEVRRAISDIQNDLESAIRRNNATSIAMADVTSIPPDLVKPGAVELVLDIRRDYATKLEESQERARKLRSDLAVEERRGQELSRILKETLPDPKISSSPRSHTGRRVSHTSSERKRMSKRLTEEAMSYFDECVLISTFDSSDFSAPEDPPLSSVGATMPAGFNASLPQENPRPLAADGLRNCLNHKKEVTIHGQLMQSPEESGSAPNSSSFESTIDERDKNVDCGRKSQFSFARKPTETTGLQQEIRSCIKNFKKDIEGGDIKSDITRYESYKSYNRDEYVSQGHAESLLFDRISLKNRIESGSLHLCAGGSAFSFSLFASVI